MARARKKVPLTVSRSALLAQGSDTEFRGLVHTVGWEDSDIIPVPLRS